MRHYLDSSVILAWLLEGNEAIAPLEGESDIASSTLLWMEVSRVLHRANQTGRLDIIRVTEARHNFARLAAGISRIAITEQILLRAAGPFPVVIGTLDALHLAAGEMWNGSDSAGELSVWTLDQQMNLCAANLGFATPLLRASS